MKNREKKKRKRVYQKIKRDQNIRIRFDIRTRTEETVRHLPQQNSTALILILYRPKRHLAPQTTFSHLSKEVKLQWFTEVCSYTGSVSELF